MFHLLFENFDQEHNSDQLAIIVEVNASDLQLLATQSS